MSGYGYYDDDENDGCMIPIYIIGFIAFILFFICVGLDKIGVAFISLGIYLVIFVIVKIYESIQKSNREDRARIREEEYAEKVRQEERDKHKHEHIFDFFHYDLRNLPFSEKDLAETQIRESDGYEVKFYRFDLPEEEFRGFKKIEIIQVEDNQFNVCFYSKGLYLGKECVQFVDFCAYQFGPDKSGSHYLDRKYECDSYGCFDNRATRYWNDVWFNAKGKHSTDEYKVEITFFGLQRPEPVEKDGVQALTVNKEDENLEGYSLVFKTAKDFYNYIEEMSRMPEVVNSLDNVDIITQLKKLKFHDHVDSRVAFLAFADAAKCYARLGYDDNAKERLDLYLFYMSLISKNYLEIADENDIALKIMGAKLPGVISRHCQCAKEDLQISDSEFAIVKYLRQQNVDSAIIDKYMVKLYRFISAMAKADGKITEQESQALAGIMNFKAGNQDIDTIKPAENSDDKSPESDKPAQIKANKQTAPKAEPKVSAAQRLNELIGLQSVKEEVNKLSSFIKIQILRNQKGMKSTPISYHCVFTGNPGTGKTTVARMLAEIYRDLGVLKSGHLVETDRSGLVAEYVGQTAVKTNKIIDSAINGVLFIDEAYSLVGTTNDFGPEAISTLLKRMEDDRDKLVVILAGYGNEMQAFIDSNPGLQSRFNRYIHFPDYSAVELADIFRMNIRKSDYTLTPEAEAKMTALFEYAVANKGKNFGNGRFARNILEQTMENQAMRLAVDSHITDAKLRTIIPEDIQ